MNSFATFSGYPQSLRVSRRAITFPVRSTGQSAAGALDLDAIQGSRALVGSNIAELLARQYAAQPGNYLVFLSSFEYLERVAALVAERYPTIPTWQQHSGMTEPQKGLLFCPASFRKGREWDSRSSAVHSQKA